MTFDEAIKAIESPYKGVMHGIKVLVHGFADNGRLAILLGRHSAKVFVVIEDDSARNLFADQKPQALDIQPITDVSACKAQCNLVVNVIDDNNYGVQQVAL